MLKRLFTHLRAGTPDMPAKPDSPPAPDGPGVSAALPPAADDAGAALALWLKWDRLPPLDRDDLEADPARLRAAQRLAASTDQALAEELLHALLAAPAPHPADRLLMAELLLRRGQASQARALIGNVEAFPPGLRARAACINGQLDFNRGDFTAARRWTDLALMHAPYAAAVQLLNANLLEAEGRLEESAAQLRAMLANRPEDHNAHISLALVLERQGRMVESLLEMVMAETFTQTALAEVPAWDGRPLRKEAVLISTNGGIGDILQHLRYAAPLRAQAPGARLVLWTRPEVAAPARLTGLFDEVRSDGVLDPAAFDWQISLVRLALRHYAEGDGTRLSRPYLHPPVGRVREMQVALEQALHEMPAAAHAAAGGLRVGLRWSGAPTNYDARRSIAPGQLRPLFKASGVAWVALLERGHAELGALHDGRVPAADLSRSIADLADTAALMRNLDLVISVDTATAHLAGAVGTPCWMLSRPDHDARWGLAAGQSTLYDSVRVFQHPGRLDWDYVLRECAQALSLLSAESRRSASPPA